VTRAAKSSACWCACGYLRQPQPHRRGPFADFGHQPCERRPANMFLIFERAGFGPDSVPTPSRRCAWCDRPAPCRRTRRAALAGDILDEDGLVAYDIDEPVDRESGYLNVIVRTTTPQCEVKSTTPRTVLEPRCDRSMRTIQGALASSRPHAVDERLG
jgi:hypothetical protein